MLPANGGWWLEVGSGYGRLLPAYWRADRQIVLVDYALDLLLRAAQIHPQENLHFLAADAYRLPFRDEVFAAGLSVRIFHHANAPHSFLKEVARTLRPDARCLVSYSNKRNLLRALRVGCSAFRHDHEAYDEGLFGTHPAHFARLARQAGLQVRLSRGTGLLDQLARGNGFLNRLLGSFPWLKPPAALLDRLADASLGRLQWTPLNFSLLHKTSAPASPLPAPPASLADLLACPHCRSTSLRQEPSQDWSCLECGKRYAHQGQVFDFR